MIPLFNIESLAIQQNQGDDLLSSVFFEKPKASEIWMIVFQGNTAIVRYGDHKSVKYNVTGKMTVTSYIELGQLDYHKLCHTPELLAYHKYNLEGESHANSDMSRFVRYEISKSNLVNWTEHSEILFNANNLPISYELKSVGPYAPVSRCTVRFYPPDAPKPYRSSIRWKGDLMNDVVLLWASPPAKNRLSRLPSELSIVESPRVTIDLSDLKWEPM
jgi:hypothetical protein